MSEYLDKVKTSTINMLLDVGADDSITETIKELAKGYCELYIGKKTPDQIRNELVDFYVEDGGEGNTEEEYEYDYIEEDDEEEDFDVAHSDTSYEALCDRAINLLYTTSSYEEFCSLLTDEYEEPFSLFILAWINILAVMDYLEADMIHFEKKGSLGFDGCIELLKIACMESESAELSSYGELSVDALKAKISDRLSLTISNGTVEDYLKNRVYVEDINTVENNVSDEPTTDEDSLIKDILQYNNTLINIACKKIMQTYRDLFTSCYQVIKPYGVLCQGSFYSIKNGQVEIERSAEAKGIYRELMKRLDFEEVGSRSFDMNKIVEQFSNNPKRILYFPNKMLDFTFGTVLDNSGNYIPASGVSSWSSYEKQYAEPGVLRSLRAAVINFHKLLGYFKEDIYEEIAVRDRLKTFLDYVVKCFTACIIVINWKKLYSNPADPTSSFEIMGIKIRMSDIEHKISLNNELPQKIISDVFIGSKGDTDAIIEPVVKVGDSSEYFVVDVQHKFKPSIVNGEPLFAYTALRSVKASGQIPDWDSLLLGKRDDESILVVGQDIDFKKRFCHWCIAGSRSGKGVWTLNILGGAIRSKKPVFYIDSKPDMASLFRSEGMSGKRMFCVNGGWQATYDTFNCCHPDSFNWRKRVPEYVKHKWSPNGELSYDSACLGEIFYFRAVMFVMSLIYVRGNVRANEELYNKLGGKDGIVAVFDEFSTVVKNLEKSVINDTNSGKLGGEFYSNKTLSDSRTARKNGKPEKDKVTEFGAWSTDLLNSFSETMNEISGSWQYKGLYGGGTEAEVSNIFILGQELFPYDSKNLSYTPNSTADKLKAECKRPLYNSMFALRSDAFFGYNLENTHYMCSDATKDAPKGRKAATRLNASARNFAYVQDFTETALRTILDMSDGSSADISENATYFKPFLIFNDGDEKCSCVDKDFRTACNLAHLDFDTMKNMHRRTDGVLEPAIGFIPYIQEMAGDIDIKGVLSKSYDIANVLVKAYAPNYDGDCIDFIYDLRPEYMFTCKTLLEAYANNRHIRSCRIYDEFFGDSYSSESSNVSDVEADDSVDFNNTEAYDRATSTANNEASNKNNEVTSSSDSSIPKTTTETKPYGSTTKSKASNWFSSRFTSNRGNKPTGQSDEYADAKASLDRLREKMKQAVDIVLQHPKYSHFSREFVEGLVDNLIMNIAKERGIPYERK